MPTATLKCLSCKERFKREHMIKKPVGNFCSDKCIIEYAVSRGRKAAKDKADKEHKSRKKIFKANDTRHQHKLTQTVFNKLRVLQELEWFKMIGLEPECISCGKNNMDWCCGHFKTVGSQGALRYSKENTKLQCNRYCNLALSGNINGNKNTRGYIQGLKDRFGELESQEIIDYCEIDRVKSWTGQELAVMRKDFNRQIRELQSEVKK